MTWLFLAAATSFTCSATLLPYIIKYAKRKNLYDEPGRRRVHTKVTPSMGGMGILLGLMVAGFLFSEIHHITTIYPLLSIITIPFIVGLLDDLIHLQPLVKLAGQLLGAVLIYFALDIAVVSSYGLIGTDTFPVPIGFILTVGVIIFVTNSFNLIDGIDGLAASVSLIILSGFGAWFFLASSPAYALFSFSLAGGIAAFLIKNWQPSRIFMGDTGSLLIGMSISILFIAFLNLNHSLPTDSPIKFRSSIVTALGVIALPFTDTVRVIIIRLSKGVSPLQADKRHIHHALIRLGRTHREAVVILVTLQLLILAIVVVFRELAEGILLLIIATVTIMFCVVLDRMLHNHIVSKKSEESVKERKAVHE